MTLPYKEKNEILTGGKEKKKKRKKNKIKKFFVQFLIQRGDEVINDVDSVVLSKMEGDIK